MERSLDAEILRLRVTLRWIAPPIWRVVEVHASSSLADLHHVLQAVLGWEDYHLHQFFVDDVRYVQPDRDDEEGGRDERKQRLGRLVGARDRFLYEYDFGDSWRHDIVVAAVSAPEPGVRYPRCVGGARACPPEDCGGARGYADLLEALADPDHEQHEELREWAGDDFDPEAFDIRAVNRALARVLPRRAHRTGAARASGRAR